MKGSLDYIIIGSGISSLLVAAELKRAGKKILILEKESAPGGCCRASETPFGEFDNGLKFFPNTQSAHSALDFLEEFLGIDFQREIQIAPPLTFNKGELQSFEGFSKKPPFGDDVYKYYLCSEHLAIQTPLSVAIKMLHQELEEELSLQSQVTEFIVDKGRIASVKVNGQKSYEAANFIYGGSLAPLLNLMPAGTFEEKMVARLRRPKYWTSVSLELFHSKDISENPAVHLLMGGTDESLPCIGQFFPVTGENKEFRQCSRWLNFVSGDMTSDNETTGNALREIKKQLRRAFPESLKCIVHERIVVSPNSHGQERIKLNNNQTLIGLENLWVSSSKAHKQKNLVGAILQAELVLAGFREEERRAERRQVHPNFGRPDPDSPEAAL